MIDFDNLVLAPCMATFGIGVTIFPKVSQPTADPYLARGVFSSSPIDVTMQDGMVFSDQQSTLGIKLSDFAIPPEIGDRLSTGVGANYWIGDVDTDGQGGALLLLRSTAPPEQI